MPQPVIVPPVPTVNQGEPIDSSPGIEQVQAVFDRVLPAIKGEPSKPKEPQKTPPAPAEPVKPAAEPEKKPDETPPAAAEQPPDTSHELPSFLEQALKSEPGQAEPVAEADWPEELPDFKNTDDAKKRYKAWREAYNKTKSELTKLREKPTLSAEQLQRMEFLEKQNNDMKSTLTRFGVEQSAEFQNNILRPLHIAWSEAARVVHDAGADPQDLAKAMALSGKAQFEALDNLMSEMPESAKAEIHDALRNYRRFDDARKAALANAPQALEGIRRRETERQYAELNKQREEMGQLFDRALSSLTDGKVEVFLSTDQPEGKWWNDQRENIIKQARDLYMENTDIGKVAVACLLAPAADVYRKLWMRSQKKIAEQDKIIKERIGSEPNLTEHGGPGNIIPSDQQLKADLEQPFSKVFLREFHKAQAASRR